MTSGISSPEQHVIDVTDARVREWSASHRLDLIEVARSTSTHSTRRALKGVREYLGMDVAFISEFVDDEQIIRLVEGDGDAFGIRAGKAIPLEQIWRWQFLEIGVPNEIREARTERGRKPLDFIGQADVGSYVGVPLEFSDRSIYGTLHCLKRAPVAPLDSRDMKTVHLLTRLISDELERHALEARNLQLRMEVVGVRALLAALEARDGYTGQHSEAVVHLSRAVASELGLPMGVVLEIEQVALLHDVGKIGIPDATLRKTGPLDDDEWKLMKQHPVIGEKIVASIDTLSHLAPAIRAEHERWDGMGYPDGLTGEDIPLASRIVLVSDAYHAMVSNRPYREAVSARAAVGELRLNSGSQFCPDVTHALIKLLMKPDVRA